MVLLFYRGILLHLPNVQLPLFVKNVFETLSSNQITLSLFLYAGTKSAIILLQSDILQEYNFIFDGVIILHLSFQANILIGYVLLEDNVHIESKTVVQLHSFFLEFK